MVARNIANIKNKRQVSNSIIVKSHCRIGRVGGINPSGHASCEQVDILNATEGSISDSGDDANKKAVVARPGGDEVNLIRKRIDIDGGGVEVRRSTIFSAKHTAAQVSAIADVLILFFSAVHEGNSQAGHEQQQAQHLRQKSK